MNKTQINIANSEQIRVLQIIGIVCGGGVESVIMNYYRNIDRSKIQFDFVIDGHGKSLLDDEIISLGGKIYKVEPYKKNILKYMWQIYRIIKDNNYQIVHSNMNTLSVFSLFAAWLAGAKIRIVHNHSTAVKSERLRSILKYILRPFNTIFANQYFACSKLAGRWMFGNSAMDNGKVTIIHNAIDLNKYAYNEQKRITLRKRLGIKKNQLVLGHVGRFVYQKNHEFLIDVFAEVVKKKSDAVLLLIGDGPLKKHIEEKVHQLNLSKNVHFLGLRTDVANLYNAMDVFILPSYYEGLVVVGIEAQANGLYMIASSNISIETKCSELMQFKKLDLGATNWAETIVQLLNTREKISVKQYLRDCYYDIQVTSINLEKLYIKFSMALQSVHYKN